MGSMLARRIDLKSDLAALAKWRETSLARIKEWLDGLKDMGLATEAHEAAFERLKAAAASDRVSVAFVAEFSRGKSELINALFFANYGKRVVPSGAGRTTMCPTEFMYDPALPVGIRLLPIETRSTQATLAELKQNPAMWTDQPIDSADSDDVALQLARVKETRFVDRALAESLGLAFDIAPNALTVEIPRWRHAIVNLPHPLLAQGLTIIDTPGLNALGNEPELTMSVLPSATAVLYVLAADAGVSRSDAEVWKGVLSSIPKIGRMVVLNKIDGLWDGMRSDAEIDADVYKQATSVAHTLDVPEGRVFPLSAQKALAARISGDTALIDKSRIQELESALSTELLPARRRLLAERFLGFVEELTSEAQSLIGARLAGIDEQTNELTNLSDGRADATQALMKRAQHEKAAYEQALKSLLALRMVVGKQAREGMKALSASSVRKLPLQHGINDARSGKQLRELLSETVSYTRNRLNAAFTQCKEAYSAVEGMRDMLEKQHQVKLTVIKPLDANHYSADIDNIERAASRQLPALPVLLPNQRANGQRMVVAAAQHMAGITERAQREIDSWVNALTAPLDRHLREQQSQIKRREESLERMTSARQTLAERLGELAEMHHQASFQQHELSRSLAVLRAAVQ
jgi:hypothetical protein